MAMILPESSLSVVLIALMKGVLTQEADPSMWAALIEQAPRVRDHMGVLGLELTLDEAEGYAWLRQRPQREGEPELPRLVPRRPLGFQVSLLLALLRKQLAEFDASGAETRLVLTRRQVHDLLAVFLAETGDEARAMDRTDAHLSKIAELGFIRRLPDGQIEVRRILRSFVDGQWLAGLDAGLAQYREHVAPRGDDA